jgi:hypothetical protein
MSKYKNDHMHQLVINQVAAAVCCKVVVVAVSIY